MKSADGINIGWIAGMPRSGTTWLSQIFASSLDVRVKFCPLFSYEFKNALDEDSSTKEWQMLFEKVYHTQSEYLDQEHLRKHGLVPAFAQKNAPSHLIIKSNRFHHLLPYLLKIHPLVRVIHIVRHPCATIYSWLSNPREFPGEAKPEEEWRYGMCRKNTVGEFWGFEDWKMVTLQALHLSAEYPERHRIIRYEDLAMNPYDHSKDLFRFMGLSLGQTTKDFIAYSQSRHDENKHSVFKKVALIESWKQKLAPHIADMCMQEVKGTELERFTKPTTLL